MDNNDDNCVISRFYDGRSILITGATGFLGKVLVHKLLSSCPGIRKIYLLIRPKKGVAARNRLLALFDGPIFRPWKGVRQDLLDKIESLDGDITLPNLGLTEENRKILINNVSVIFHSAATVRFDEDLTK
jgi:fatty acyl-CoA reductase